MGKEEGNRVVREGSPESEWSFFIYFFLFFTLVSPIPCYITYPPPPASLHRLGISKWVVCFLSFQKEDHFPSCSRCPCCK
jgi:hypothetical protein